jgi:hypothetical protein
MDLRLMPTALDPMKSEFSMTISFELSIKRDHACEL